VGISQFAQANHGSTAKQLYFGGSSLCRCTIRTNDDSNIGSFGGELQSDGSADALGPAADQRNTPRQTG
jgi:hypothetical protein